MYVIHVIFKKVFANYIVVVFNWEKPCVQLRLLIIDLNTNLLYKCKLLLRKPYPFLCLCMCIVNVFFLLLLPFFAQEGSEEK